jgi:hypothetical protein
MRQVREALTVAIAESLNEGFYGTYIEISELNTQGEIRSVSGSFRIAYLFDVTSRRKGKFEAKLDKNLNVINLKIQEETR